MILRKAAEDSRTPRRFATDAAFNTARASWSAAVLCRFWLPLVAIGLAAGGCATTQNHSVPRPTGDALVDGHSAIDHGPSKDKVLWQYRTALAAMRRGQWNEAKLMLDDAIARISNVMGADKDAKKARGYFSPEAKKTFIG